MLPYWVILLELQKIVLSLLGCWFAVAGISKISAQERPQTYFRTRFLPRSEATQTSILLRLRGGSSLEREEEEGFVHLIEHLIYRGDSQNQPSGVFRQKYRASLFGGFTDRYQSDFSLLVNSQRTEDALRDLWDAVFHLHFSTPAIEQEISLILQEQEIHPDFFQAEYHTLFPASPTIIHSPYGAPTHWKTEAPEILLKRIQAFYQRVFQPTHFDLILVGKWDSNTLHTFLQKQNESTPTLPSCCPHLPTMPAPHGNFIHSSTGTFLFWIQHPEKIPLKLIEEGAKSGYMSSPSLSQFLHGRLYETRLVAGKNTYYLIFFFWNESHPKKLAQQIETYFQKISIRTLAFFQQFCKASAWKLFLHMESVLHTTDILYSWSEQCLLSEEQLLQRIAEIAPETLRSILSSVRFSLHFSKKENLRESSPKENAVFSWPSSFPIWLKTTSLEPILFQKKKLPNHFTFLYQQVEHAQTEAITLLISGKCFPDFFVRWKKKWEEHLPQNGIYAIKTGPEFMAITFSFPAHQHSQWIPFLRKLFETVSPPSARFKKNRNHSNVALKIFSGEIPAEFYLNPILLSYAGLTDFTILEKQILLFQEPLFWANAIPFEIEKSIPSQSLEFLREEEQISISMRWKGVPPNHPDYLPLKVVGEGMGSALFEWMVYQTGQAYEMQFYVQDQVYFPTLGLKIRLLKKNIPLVQNFLRTYFLSAEALRIAHQELKERFLLSLRSISDSSYTMAQLDFLGLPYHLQETLEEFMPFYAEELYQKIWQNYFVEQDPILWVE